MKLGVFFYRKTLILCFGASLVSLVLGLPVPGRGQHLDISFCSGWRAVLAPGDQRGSCRCSCSSATSSRCLQTPPWGFCATSQAAPAVPKIAVPPWSEQFPHREQGKVFPVFFLRIWDGIGGGSFLVKHSVGMGKQSSPCEAAWIYLGRVFPLINCGGVGICWERH